MATNKRCAVRRYGGRLTCSECTGELGFIGTLDEYLKLRMPGVTFETGNPRFHPNYLIFLHPALRQLPEPDQRGLLRYGRTQHARKHPKASGGRPYRRPVREQQLVVQQSPQVRERIHYRDQTGKAMNPLVDLQVPCYVVVYCPGCGARQDLVVP